MIPTNTLKERFGWNRMTASRWAPSGWIAVIDLRQRKRIHTAATALPQQKAGHGQSPAGVDHIVHEQNRGLRLSTSNLKLFCDICKLQAMPNMLIPTAIARSELLLTP